VGLRAAGSKAALSYPAVDVVGHPTEFLYDGGVGVEGSNSMGGKLFIEQRLKEGDYAASGCRQN
jgi:hypothetical protein